MHAMQYEITLPADYDMAIIRTRVRTKGPLLDDFPGLGTKAYCVRERGIDGSPVNQYAPFYLWHDPSGTNAFLWGNGFRGLQTDFGRPVVRQWLGAGYERGPATTANAATKHVERLAPDADPGAAVEAALATLTERSRAADVVSGAVAVDTRDWEILHFTLWSGEARGPGVRYRVLHVSAPAEAALPAGPHWR